MRASPDPTASTPTAELRGAVASDPGTTPGPDRPFEPAPVIPDPNPVPDPAPVIPDPNPIPDPGPVIPDPDPTGIPSPADPEPLQMGGRREVASAGPLAPAR